MGGGIDLVFPHHENEKAQSEAALGKKFVNYWMHNGYMNIKGEKMSKSLGNIILARDVLKKYSPEVIRLFILSAHYRSPLDFTWENIEKIKQGYREIYNTLQILNQLEITKKNLNFKKSEYINNFLMALDDDFNTPEAIAVIFNLVRRTKEYLKKELKEEDILDLKIIEGNMKEMCGIFKIMPEIEKIDEKIIELVKQRDKLRKEKKYDEADKIKNEIINFGYELEDAKTKTFILKKM